MVYGRSTILTEELTTRICDYIKAGNYFKVACAACGIVVGTALRWKSDGKKEAELREKQQEGEELSEEESVKFAKLPETPTMMHDFFKQVQTANAVAEARSVKKIDEDKSWQSAAHFLACKFPTRWANQQRRTIRLEVSKNLQELSEEQLDRVIAGEPFDSVVDNPENEPDEI